MRYWTTCVAAHVPPTLVANTLVISATSRCSGGSFGWFLEVNIYHSRQVSISCQMLMLLLMLHCFVIYSLCHLVATPALFRRISSLPWRVITVLTALGSKVLQKCDTEKIVFPLQERCWICCIEGKGRRLAMRVQKFCQIWWFIRASAGCYNLGWPIQIQSPKVLIRVQFTLYPALAK